MMVFGAICKNPLQHRRIERRNYGRMPIARPLPVIVTARTPISDRIRQRPAEHFP